MPDARRKKMDSDSLDMLMFQGQQRALAGCQKGAASLGLA